MYKGLESKFVTVCNHVLICLSMCQVVLFICTCCLLICVHRCSNFTWKSGAVWCNHKTRILYYVSGTQHFWSTATQPARNAGPRDLAWTIWIQCVCFLQQKINEDTFLKMLSLSHLLFMVKYLQGKIQLMLEVQVSFPPPYHISSSIPRCDRCPLSHGKKAAVEPCNCLQDVARRNAIWN